MIFQSSAVPSARSTLKNHQKWQIFDNKWRKSLFWLVFNPYHYSRTLPKPETWLLKSRSIASCTHHRSSFSKPNFGFFIIFQPYVTFGLFEKKRKVILIWICFASVIFLFIGLLLLFYVTPIHDCEVCKYFNCIPITKDFCADQNINLEAEVW